MLHVAWPKKNFLKKRDEKMFAPNKPNVFAFAK